MAALVIRLLSQLLAEPRLRGVDVNSPGLLDLQRRILAEKPMMRGVLEDFYRACMTRDDRWFTGAGRRVEIGAGASLFKAMFPDIISTDIKPSPGLDMVVDAQRMPFPDGSLRAVFGINCFHHIPSPDAFFRELVRVLGSGGGCVLIEPHSGPVARVMYRRLFATETFDTTQPGWDAPPGTGVMTGANQALSFIVFVRDRARFESAYPELEILELRVLTNWPRYLLSGGLNFRSLAPAFATPLVRIAEWLMAPLAPWLGLHRVIVLRRRATGRPGGPTASTPAPAR